VLVALTDSCGRHHTYLRLAVTDRCNLRCHYCMPEEGVRRSAADLLSDDEIVHLAGLFARLGLVKLRLTGGEPALRPGLADLVARLTALPGLRTVSMTTNGLLLFEQAASLRRAGLAPDGLNVSLDSLRPDRFRAITGYDRLADALAGLVAARQAGFSPLKLNVVVMGGLNDDELCDFVAFALAHHLNVRFIEYMPFPGNRWEPGRLVRYETMRDAIAARYQLLPVAETRGVAKDFRLADAPGLVSFITPLSAGFCHSCTRLRLTADGALKTCLFHPAEVSLRDLLRRGAEEEELITAIRAAVAMKPAAHPPVEELVRSHCRSMAEIGG
jgi:cyclic pyranopterin phosphate synthase